MIMLFEFNTYAAKAFLHDHHLKPTNAERIIFNLCCIAKLIMSAKQADEDEALHEERRAQLNAMMEHST